MAARTKKVLIIKLGYSETLDAMLSLETSLGDVLRSTFILHYFSRDRVTWLVDEKAKPLLESNGLIRDIFTYDPHGCNELRRQEFDIVVNFEKIPDVCCFAQALRTKEYFGFRLNGRGIETHSDDAAACRLISISRDIEDRKRNRDCWQKILAEVIGKKWAGQKYVLGYRPASDVKWDIGFNWATSAKWENKIWPRAYWNELEALLKPKYSVSWQQGLNSLYEYIDWINSCGLLVTSDSLGLHICFALGKRVIALFGPTSPYEMFFYDCGEFILPRSPYDCIPCFKPRCSRSRPCMEYINPEYVRDRIENAFKKSACAPAV
ncbi:MAG TPA: glycosyltransferase family 9 protein [Candidatus Omnitrophota bacterium]|nr:glycosyltransferase family 9 protein [Candidatus Omnitrophota bacterium]